MPPPMVFLLLFLGLILLFALGHHFWGEIRMIRKALLQLPRVPIAQAAERQMVRLEGQVQDGEALTAPFPGRRCVFYLAIVEQHVSNGKTSSWQQRLRETRGLPFALDDGTGRAIVDPSAARIDVQLDSTTQSGTFDDATPVEEAFLQRHGMKSEGWVFNKSLRYREGIIAVGERIAVAGRAVREPDPDGAMAGGYRDGPATRLRVGGSQEAALLLSDSTEVVGN